MKKALRTIGAFVQSARGWSGRVLKKPLKTLLGQASRLTAVTITLLATVNCIPAFGGAIGGSKLATGTEQLVEDVTSWLLVIAPLVTVVAVIYYLIRKTVADEMDHKKWNTRITTAIICCIGVVAASLLINVIVGYYQ